MKGLSAWVATIGPASPADPVAPSPPVPPAAASETPEALEREPTLDPLEAPVDTDVDPEPAGPVVLRLAEATAPSPLLHSVNVTALTPNASQTTVRARKNEDEDERCIRQN